MSIQYSSCFTVPKRVKGKEDPTLHPGVFSTLVNNPKCVIATSSLGLTTKQAAPGSNESGRQMQERAHIRV